VAVINKIFILIIFGSFWYYSKQKINLKLQQLQRIGEDTSMESAFLFLWDLLFIYY